MTPPGSRHIPRAHIPRARIDPITSDADARALVTALCSTPLVDEVVVITLDAQWCGLAVLRVAGTTRPEAMLDVVEAVCKGARPADTARVFMASSRPAHPVESADVERWLEASDHLDDAGLELVEWYVMSDQGVECPRDLFGEPPRWPDALAAMLRTIQ